MKTISKVKMVFFLIIILTTSMTMSCMKKEEMPDGTAENEPVVVDSVVIDSVMVDSVMVDSVIVDSMAINPFPNETDFFIDCDLVVKDYTPEVMDFDFYIEAEIAGKTIRYRQINRDWINTSNRFSVSSQSTSLQAFSDSFDIAGYWLIDMNSMDIRDIALPYKLEGTQGFVRWYDNRLDQTIENTDYCQGVDNGCTFLLKTSTHGNSMVINNVNVADQIIEGEFEGKAILKRTGLVFGSDSTICYAFTKGKFKINYRVE